MVFPSDLPSLPDPSSRTEADGLTLRAKLSAIFSPYKTYIEALGAKVGANASAVTTSHDYQISRSREQLAVFAHSGNVAVSTGTLKYRFPWAVTILGVSAVVGTAPTGASIRVDINANGTTIFTNQANRPEILSTATTTTSEPTPDVTTLAAGSYLTRDIDTIGTSASGADLTVFVRYRQT